MLIKIDKICDWKVLIKVVNSRKYVAENDFEKKMTSK